jgi:GNAT superfamily N-acetyltransferase
MEDFTVRTLKPEEAAEVTNLITAVFDTFIAPDYTPAGIQHFYEFITPEAITQRIGENSFVLVACYSGRIIGVIAMRGYSHIALLFTSRDWHGKGVATKLLEAATQKCRKTRPDVKQFTVNASTYAISFYERFGFTIQGPEQNLNGIRFTPMSKNV